MTMQAAGEAARPGQALLPALAGLLLLAACSGDRPEGAQLTVVVVGDARNPAGLAQRLADEVVSPTLIARDGAGQIVPGLASSWRFVDDGRSLILRLKPTRWSDAKPLVAADVAAAFRRAAERREPLLVRAGIANAAAIAARRLRVSRLGVTAPISRVIEVRLEAASPLLLGWLAEPGLRVTAAGESRTLAAYDARGPVQRRLLRRRSIVSTPDARPAEIIVSGAEDAPGAVAEFMRGETDIVIGEGLGGLGEARASAPAALRLDPVWAIYGYAINTSRAGLRDPQVRLALAMAVDRPGLLQRFGVPAMVPVETMLPPSLRPQPTVRPRGTLATIATTVASGVATAVGQRTVPKVVPGVVPGAGAQTRPQTQQGAGPGGAGGISGEAVPGAAATTPAEAPAENWRQLSPEARLTLAQRLLAAAGYGPDTPLQLVLLIPPGREHRNIAESVGADWARVGAVLAVSEVPAGTIGRLVARGDFDLAVNEDALPVPDPVAALARWRCSADGPWCNPEFDALVTAAAAAGPADRPALVARAETMLAAAPPLVPLFTPVRWALVGPNVDGWSANAAGSHPLARLAVTGE
jgi:ABC-type transport system substrate-binding protein